MSSSLLRIDEPIVQMNARLRGAGELALSLDERPVNRTELKL